jgi:hypothetical protein
MAKVHVEFECKCFKESDCKNDIEYPTFEEALNEAKTMVAEMAENFCGKHTFGVENDGRDVTITVELAEPAK